MLLHEVVVIIFVAIHHENRSSTVDVRLGLRASATSAETPFAEVLVVIEFSIEFGVVLIPGVVDFECVPTLDTFRHAGMLPPPAPQPLYVSG
jgi:hypothetical protein